MRLNTVNATEYDKRWENWISRDSQENISNILKREQERKVKNKWRIWCRKQINALFNK